MLFNKKKIIYHTTMFYCYSVLREKSKIFIILTNACIVNKVIKKISDKKNLLKQRMSSTKYLLKFLDLMLESRRVAQFWFSCALNCQRKSGLVHQVRL